MQEANENARYKYISQHEFSEEEFSFSFMKDRSSENFPDQKARVVMLGGYMLAGTAQGRYNIKTDTRMLVFLDRDMPDIESLCSTLIFISTTGGDQLQRHFIPFRCG